jgi:hypothetical protein
LISGHTADPEGKKGWRVGIAERKLDFPGEGFKRVTGGNRIGPL